MGPLVRLCSSLLIRLYSLGKDDWIVPSCYLTSIVHRLLLMMKVNAISREAVSSASKGAAPTKATEQVEDRLRRKVVVRYRMRRLRKYLPTSITGILLTTNNQRVQLMKDDTLRSDLAE